MPTIFFDDINGVFKVRMADPMGNLITFKPTFSTFKDAQAWLNQQLRLINFNKGRQSQVKRPR